MIVAVPRPVSTRRPSGHLTGVERTFGADEIIVSKTDPRGHITYANGVFQRIASYTEAELIGKPHSLVRHPDMPRCIFRYLWMTIPAGKEVFAYVVNRASNGDHYWVFAHITPTFDASGAIVSYHSNRRSPSRSAVSRVREIYELLLREERRHRHPQQQWMASLPLFVKFLEDKKMSYEEFVFTLT